VTTGSPVYSSDGEKIGKVKEVGAAHFKVETGLLQRDYWLPGDLVSEAVSDVSVALSIDKADIEQHKILGEPSQAA
jgi:hypothetical protein